jgi:hypothetical protein
MDKARFGSSDTAGPATRILSPGSAMIDRSTTSCIGTDV